MELGENNSIDFSFEDLKFIDEGNEGNEGGAEGQAAANPNANQEGAEGGEGAEGAEGQQQGIDPPAGEGGEGGKGNAARAAGDAAEGEGSEGVGGGSTEGDAGDDGEESSPQIYQNLTKVLLEEGVLSSVEESSIEKIKDVNALIDVIKTQIKEEEFKDLNDTQKTILTDMREGVSEDTAAQYKTAMNNLNKIDEAKIEEDKQVRFDLIFQDFRAKGFEEKRAIELANRSFETKKDIDDAKAAKTSLVKAVNDGYKKTTDAEKAAYKAEKEAKDKEKDDLKNKILNSKEAIKGFEIPENIRKEVYQDMVKTVSNDPETGVPENALMKYQRENPLEYTHKLYYLFKVTNGFENLDYFKAKKTSSSVKDLETALRQSSHVSGGGDPSFADDGNAHVLDIGEIVLPGE